MMLRNVLLPIVLVLLAAPGCLDRKSLQVDGSVSGGEAGSSDKPGISSLDAGDGAAGLAVDATLDVATVEVGAVIDASPAESRTPQEDGTDLLAVDTPTPDAPTDLAQPDAPVVVPSPDAPSDVSADAPDVGGTCPTGQKACMGSSGTVCIAASACCVNADCPGTCQTCDATHACGAVLSQDDPSGRCAGTCDATGACKSKKGQTCQTVAAGCASGTTCSPDGYCCDTACTGSCQACDIAGYLGTCTPVASGNPHGNRASCGTDATCGGTCEGKADGTCSYPTKNCGAGPSCSGTDKVIAQSTCMAGTCQSPAATTCTGGFACSSSTCKATCQTSADCQADFFCYNQSCHSDVVSVGVGGNTCVALKDGRVMCWGLGAIGDGVNHTSPVGPPVQVAGLSNARRVQASSNSVCALTSTGTVSCWGSGQYGQLGNGANTPAPGQGQYFSNSPVSVITSGGSPLAGIVSLYAGADAFCAVSSTGIYCWGENASGMLGFSVPPNPDSVLSALQVQGAPALNPFGMGHSFQFGVQDSTTLQAWGLDEYGTVDPAASDAIFPIWNSKTITTTTAISQVVGGGLTGCILYVTGEVQCWGSNLDGALGSGASFSADDPIPGHKISGLIANHITSGADFMCAQTSDASSVYCWGNNLQGVVSPDTSTNYSTPTRVSLNLPAGLSVMEVTSSCTAGHVCAIISDGSLMCWGTNGYLETGTGSTSSAVTSPTYVQATW